MIRMMMIEQVGNDYDDDYDDNDEKKNVFIQ